MGDNRDEHCRQLEARGVSVIVEMEREVCRDIPAEFHAIARRNLSNAMARKYELRLGTKGGSADHMADLDKRDNYRFRAVHGCWRPTE